MTSNLQITGPALKLRLKWDDVLNVVTDLGVHGIAATFGLAPGPGGIAGLFGKLRKVVKLEEPPESQAWTLVALCFAGAIDELRPETSDPELRKAARATLDQTKTLIGGKTYFLEPDFFVSPVSLPLYRDMRTTLVEALDPLWPGAGSVGGKLDRAFNCALYEIIRRDQNLFERLREMVSGPGLEAQRLEHDWTAYRERLRHGYQVKPVFGQEQSRVALAQLYVEPRAIWRENAQGEDGEKKTIQHLVDLHADMRTWLNERTPSRCIRLVRGGPGSGKSSFAKAFAASLAEQDDWRPILIELQRLKGEGSLAERTTGLLVDHEELFRDDPLDRAHLDDNRPLVLIFDGLDELAVPEGPGAKRVAEELWDDLDDLLGRLNSSTKTRALAIVTGRDAIIEAALDARRGRRLRNQDALAVVGLHELDRSKLQVAGGVDTGDQRADWWQRYARATRTNPEPPPVFSSDQLRTLTDEPLLCYLLALSGKAEESRERAIDNINEVYDKLIGDIWQRTWGDASADLDEAQRLVNRQTGPIGAFEDRDAFEQILESIAIAAWRGGESRIATYDAFEAAIDQTPAEDIWRRSSRAIKARPRTRAFRRSR